MRGVCHGHIGRQRDGHRTGDLTAFNGACRPIGRALEFNARVRAGAVTVFGQPAGAPGLCTRTGYVTQSPSIYADLTVTENAHYFAAITGVDDAAAERDIEEVGLAGAAHQLVRTLSGGQHSRALLACTQVGEPELLVLDEPTPSQEQVLREELRAAFSAARSRGPPCWSPAT